MRFHRGARAATMGLSWLVLMAYVGLMATSVEGRLMIMGPSLFKRMHETMFAKEKKHVLEQEVAAFTRESRFPTAGRTLEEKKAAAEAFLTREIAKSGVIGVGAAIVFHDEVVLSKGYGLRLANDSTSKVTSTSIFQIGSVTKTFIALGLGILVDEGKLDWNDPVKQHYPSFRVFDVYAEKYATIGDLLAMNSGYGEIPDFASISGLYPSDEDFVNHLRYLEPSRSLRGGHEYANVNFAVLGLVIESVTGQPWDVFLEERIWKPLGMTRTFASALQVKDDNNTAFGHFACGGDIKGPYSLVTDPQTQLIAGGTGDKVAAGSVLSSADDMAKFLRLILNKGTIDGITIVSPRIVEEMITGKYRVNQEFHDMYAKGGRHYNADGNTLASGYGFDFVTHGLWGYGYADKSGDTLTHLTRTGFAPVANVGVVLMGNTQTPEGLLTFPLDHIRSYVMGIFLDVPTNVLDFSYNAWRAADQLKPVMEGVPACGVRFWKNPPFISLDDQQRKALVGTYVAETSPEFFASLEINQVDSKLVLRYGKLVGELLYYTSIGNQSRAFVWNIPFGPSFLDITKQKDKFVVDVGIKFVQQ